MPVVMVPVHFDRDPNDRKQSCLRSFVLRPFLTSDFMTGLAALPGRDLPEEVSFLCTFWILIMLKLLSKILFYRQKVLL